MAGFSPDMKNTKCKGVKNKMTENIEPKVIAYDYLFNYFGGDKFKDKIIFGASVSIAIHVYKNGKEVKFTEDFTIEGPCKNFFLNNIIKVSFDREKQFVVKENIYAKQAIQEIKGWDKFETEVIGFSLDFLVPPTEETKKLEEMLGIGPMPSREVMQVTEEEFREFLKSHADDFDISDNRDAQVPSYMLI